jgi:hypothetical protein
MNALPGVGGTLFPSQFIADGLEEALAEAASSEVEKQRRHFCLWWDRVAATCGPATGIRALFDLVAMPLAGMLGFRAREAVFADGRGTARLETAGGTSVGLMVLTWASRPSLVWRDLAGVARRLGAAWTIVVAPPFVSVVPCRGFGIRRSVDFRLPDALDSRTFARFRLICQAGAFDRVASPEGVSAIDGLVAKGLGFQDRVRTDLQKGVVDALDALGTALDRHARSRGAEDSFNEALTLVYRMLFLLFAESRDLVPRGQGLFGSAYSISSLCRGVLAGEPHTGLWDGLAAITRLSRAGCHTGDLIVRPFNGRLFARAAAPSLESQRITRLPTRASKTRDAAMGRAMLSLASRPGHAGRTAIAYSDLGVEQLGAVYERVLDLNPELRPGRSPAEAAGGRSRRGGGRHSARRKETGTFYTPQPLAEFVVRRTLAPLVAGATPDRILALRVVDPAMGSGAFLVAACRYLAGAYERALIDEGRTAATDFDEDRRTAIRRLIAERCLAGVDANPLAVQLARLSLWLATLARGKPLSFLDHRLRVGNSLLGASPDDLARMAPIGRGRAASHPGLPLFETDNLEHDIRQASIPLRELARRSDETVRDVREKEALWNQISSARSPLEPWRVACSLWCARWFWPRGSPPSTAETRAAIDALLRRDRTLAGAHLAGWIDTARSIGDGHQFFHWPLEFADLFYDDSGAPRQAAGFDAVIGNPPWEMLRNDGDGPRAGTPAVVKFIRESGLYPGCRQGHLNLYQPFLERALSIAHGGGRVGLILPWGLAADDGAAALRKTLVERSRVHTLVGLDNAHAIFPVHRGLRFLVLVASPGGATGEIRARFGLRTIHEIDDLPAREESLDRSAYPIRLSARVLATVGGRALRIPDARDPSLLAFLQQLMARFPPLGKPGGWGAEFGRELNATEDRAAFGRTGLPIIEGKHISPFVALTNAPAHRIERERACERLSGRPFEHARLAYRDVSAVTNRLSLIAAVVPRDVVTTHTLLCLRTPAPRVRQHFLCALLNSFVLNAVVRMLMGGHVTTTLVESLPVPEWTGDATQRRIAAIACRLARSSPAAALHAELQASIARLYALDSQTFCAVLETFPLIPRQERDRALQRFVTPH